MSCTTCDASLDSKVLARMLLIVVSAKHFVFEPTHTGLLLINFFASFYTEK
jgi:hypothetical protein